MDCYLTANDPKELHVVLQVKSEEESACSNSTEVRFTVAEKGMLKTDCPLKFASET